MSLQSSSVEVVCSKKPGSEESTHVLDFMLEEKGNAVGDDLPAGPKRCNIILSSFIVSNVTHAAIHYASSTTLSQKKHATILLSVTSPYVDRFSKFCH